MNNVRSYKRKYYDSLEGANVVHMNDEKGLNKKSSSTSNISSKKNRQTYQENDRKYKYLFQNIIAFLCGNMGTKLISFFLVPLYTNILAPSEYGEIDLILSISGVLSPFIACGIHEGVMRFSLDKNADRPLVLSIGMRIFIVSSIIFIGICYIFKFIPIVSENTVFLYFYCTLNELMTIILCYIRGCDNIKFYSFLGFLSALFTAILNIIFLVVLNLGLGGYKASMLISPIMTSVVAVVGGHIKEVSFTKWDKNIAQQMMKYSLFFIPNAILWWCINASDRFFISYICGTAENGIYAVAYKIPTLLNTVASIFMQSWQMSAIKEYEDGGESNFYDQVYRLLTFFMGLATLFLILMNKPVLSIYVGQEYTNAWRYSPPLMVAFFMGALGTFWGSFYIASKNMKTYLNSAICGAAVNIVLNIIMIIKIGTIGAAFATMVSYIVVMIIMMAGKQKEVGIKAANRQMISAAICMVIALISAYLPDIWLYGIGILNIVAYLVINRKQVQWMIDMIGKLIYKVRSRS